MEWIDREINFPECDRILCCDHKQVFVCDLIESKWGYFYRSIDCTYSERGIEPEWTHWMPLPEPHKQM